MVIRILSVALLALDLAACVAEEPAAWQQARGMLDFDESTLSQPTLEVLVERDVWIPMRDGVELSTDIFRPDGPGPFPALLMRTPYGKANSARMSGRAYDENYFATRGYVVLLQDSRGRNDSPGTFETFRDDADGRTVSSEGGDLLEHRLEADTLGAVRRPLEDEAPRDVKVHEHDFGLSTLEHETAAVVLLVLLPMQDHPEEAGRDGEGPLGRTVGEGEAFIKGYVRLIHDESELTVAPFGDRDFASEVEGDPLLQAHRRSISWGDP